MPTGAGCTSILSPESSWASTRGLSYIAVAFALLLAILTLRNTAWKGNAELHTLAETIASGAAIVAASMSLMRYHTKKEIKFLLVGSGFIGAAFLDGYHAAITSSFLARYAPSALAALTPWSGATSRLFLSLLMLAGLASWHTRTEVTNRWQEILVYLVVGAWNLVNFLFFALVNIKPLYYPNFFIHRPAELIPGVLFALATAGYLSKGRWKTDPFEYWLVLSLVAATAAQIAMPIYDTLFDGMFFAAHCLKIAQYALVLCGLYASTYSIFRREADSAKHLYQVNQSLSQEITERQMVEAELRQAHEELEARVRSRTQDLAVANNALSAEVVERTRAETRLAKANTELQSRADQLERQTREMELFSELSAALSACADFQEAEQSIAKVLGLAFPRCSGAIWILNNSRNQLQLAQVWGTGTDLAAFAPEDCCGIRLGRVYLGDGTQLIDCAHVRELRFYVCAPLIAQGEVLGTVFIQAQTASDLTNAALVSGASKLAQEIAERAAVALSSLKLRQVLRDAAIRDPLTGLFNRRYMEETFPRELARCTRVHKPLAVLMIDIDHFKSFNDRHGHDIGDLVLKHTGVLLRSSVRTEDIVCRLGGEELVVIMPEADLDGAVRRANDLRVRFASMSVNYKGTFIEPVTVSIGVASTMRDGTSMEELMRAADLCLYSAKGAGRNKVCASPAKAPTDNVCGYNQGRPPWPSVSSIVIE